MYENVIECTWVIEWIEWFDLLIKGDCENNVKAVVRNTIKITLPARCYHSLLPCPKIKDVKNEKPLSEEKGTKKGHVTKKSLQEKRKELKARHENVILLQLCF